MQAVYCHWAAVEKTFSTRRTILAVTSVVFLLPLCLVKHMSNLARTSALSLAAVGCIVFVVVIRNLVGAPGAVLPSGEQAALPFLGHNVFPSIGIFG